MDWNGEEQPLNSHYAGWQPTTVVNAINQPSPGRREQAIQPPLLTTALGISQFHPGSTPLSSTSLSSPFTHGQSPCVSSPANGWSASSSSTSSMSSRQTMAYNVPYNPQHWGPMGSAPAQSPHSQTNTVVRVLPQRTHTEDSLSPPPPPYSPPSNQSQMSQVFTQANANIPLAPTVTPPPTGPRNGDFNMITEYQRRSVPRQRPVSMVYSYDAGSHRQSLPPPPPPQGNVGSRSASHSRIDGYQNLPYHATAHSRSRLSISEYGHSNQSPSLRAMAPDPTGDLEPLERPPASRRAVSAGAVVSNASSSRGTSQSRIHSPSNNGWGPGMPLPPPPPGPPPSTRSISVSGSSEASSANTVQSLVRARARPPPPLMGTDLGSIPPTPADWVDEEYINHRPSSDKESLYIDTTKTIPDSDLNDTSHQRTPGSGGLFRSAAVREPSAKGIRERRIERRNRQSQVFEDFSAVSSSGNPWADVLEQIKPSNLVFPESKNSPDQPRQPTSSKLTPRSAQSLNSDGRHPSRSRASSTGLFSEQSSYQTPKKEQSPSRSSRLASVFAQTPPFSPNGESSSAYVKEASQAIPPRALPTPPLNPAKEAQPRPRTLSRGAEDRPISHILNMPNHDALSCIKPLSPRRISSHGDHQVSLESVVKTDTQFLEGAIQRHKQFIEQESSAVDEIEALKLFSQFIIGESQIRRERYAAIWDSNSNSFEVEDVRNKLFELPPKPDPIQILRAAKPKAPVLQIPPTQPGRPESAWWNNFQPCLSPIAASLNMSNDEMSSRGRAPSRWWESKTGSSNGGAEQRVQRSKRESKYMGLPRDTAQWDQERTPSKLDDTGSNYSDNYAAYGPDEYPPEKSGSHEASSSHIGGKSEDRFGHFMASWKLDISRLITLPPPYPRHYPAVNNSHPELISYRTVVRSITDFSEIKSTRQRYQLDVERMIQDHQEAIQDGRRQFKANIQNQIQEGSITFAEAAEAEAAMIVEYNKSEREMAKRQLDMYQEIVLKPMHAIIKDRIEKATTCIDELSSQLFNDAQSETPDQTQEEGDEKPELLERLTQLKWLFEAREQLHREAFDLVSDRDEKYKSIALLPYKQSQNEDKVRETQDFFTKDALNRRVQQETESFTRLESFMDVIEQNVVRGVEIQLSAFWDIAPNLLALVQQVPEDLRGFQVKIPVDEYDENPSYHAHPLQYLYSLLSHAEKSSYQYIESQINLLCLLHEVRSAVIRTNRNLTEAEMIQQGEQENVVRRKMQEAREKEEVRLTSDLKDKVATVESQWTEALGSQIQGLRERVKEQLIVEDGWEDLERLEQE
ncbi:hypothetical protein N7495_003823 [Penicillium taxi]|uniref:uncharacterized protein n=1 Tax=Penicillium taxi TaxID=168475 RepID=UPI0025457777|nr:uncharacterized protein N7495_003823 [Penicillium taxi]KAJ5899079.1 hypothetical protein N7495_003823 [Penicillium taxi]